MSYGTVQAEKMTTESGYSLGAGNASSFKNRLINGNMTIAQRGTSSVAADSGNLFAVDRWFGYNSTTSKFTMQQDAGGVTPPAGFTDYLGATSTSAYSVGSSDYFGLTQRIEGFNVADLGWGSANAKTVTLSFWVRSSLTGTFGGNFSNAAYNRGYPFTYTISAANTWEYKTVTVAGDTTGTWGTTNGLGIELVFSLGMGSSLQTTPNAWTNAWLFPTGAVSVVGTNGATFYITGCQLEVGTVATSFDYRPYGTELFLCQRYFERITLTGSGGDRPIAVGATYLSGSDVYSQTVAFFKVLKRADPTVAFTAASTFGQHCPGVYRNTLTSISLNTASTTALQIGGISGTGGGSPSSQGLCAILEAASGQQPSISISAEL
jgi:hypothetical protein